MHLLVPWTVSVAFGVELTQCPGKNLTACGFACSSNTYKHNTMTDLHSLEKLDDLLDVLCWSLVFDLSQLVFDCNLQLTIIDWNNFDSWEQVSDNTFEQRKIMFEEFWHVGILHSSDQNDIL